MIVHLSVCCLVRKWLISKKIMTQKSRREMEVCCIAEFRMTSSLHHCFIFSSQGKEEAFTESERGENE